MLENITVPFSLAKHEHLILKELCIKMGGKNNKGRPNISQSKMAWKALEYMLENPSVSIDEIPRAPKMSYRIQNYTNNRKVLINCAMSSDMLKQLTAIVDKHSASRNAVMRQALINYAEANGFNWDKERPKMFIDPSWEKIQIDSLDAAKLAGVTRQVIVRRAREGKFETVGISIKGNIGIVNPSKVFMLADIVRFFEVPENRVNNFLLSYAS